MKAYFLQYETLQKNICPPYQFIIIDVIVVRIVEEIYIYKIVPSRAAFDQDPQVHIELEQSRYPCTQRYILTIFFTMTKMKTVFFT